VRLSDYATQEWWRIRKIVSEAGNK